MTTILQADYIPEGMQPVLVLDPTKGMPLTTITASLTEDEAPAPKTGASRFGKTTTAPKAAFSPKEDVKVVLKNVYKELMKMLETLNQLELLVLESHAKDQGDMGTVSDITYTASHQLSQKSIETLKQQAEQMEKAKKASFWEKIGAKIIGVCGILLAGGIGPGVVAAALFIMQECGVFDKLSGMPAWAKVLIVVAASVVAGGVAKLATMGAQQLLKQGAEALTKEAAKAALTSSAKMGAAMATTQLLPSSGLIQDAMMATVGQLDKDAAKWISVALTVVLTMVMMYLAGGAAANELLSSPVMLKAMKVAAVCMIVGSFIQFGAGVANAMNYKEMAKIEDTRAVEESTQFITKSVFHMVETLLGLLTSCTQDKVKRFEDSYKHLDSISRPWEVAAAALAGRI